MIRQIHRLQARVLLVGAALCLALAGCGADEQSVGAPNKPEPRVETLSTGQIADVVTTINQGEVKQAQDALDHLEDAAVHAYAEQIIADHQAAETQLDAVTNKLGAKAEPSALKTEIEQLADKMTQRLAQESPAAYPATFIDVQVQMHKKALGTVDKLLGQTKETEMREYLETYRATLQQHLDQAERLRKRFPEPQSSR